MRYSKDHKAATHARIVQNAATQLREKGARGVGVADLMRDVGLTHGGFYAHFGSRDDLVNEAIATALDQTTEKWRRLLAGKSLEAGRAAIVVDYLSARHRDNPGYGCALASLAADVSREGAKTRRIFLTKLEAMVGLLAAEGGRPPKIRERQKAFATVATMIGAIVLARVAGNSPLSQEILEAGRAAVSERNRIHDTRKPAPRKRSGSSKSKRGAGRLTAEKITAGGKRT